jgi:membrane protease YdiL (CAAX protease family)
MRPPDALDGARVLALGLGALAVSGLFSGHASAEVIRGGLQILFLALPLVYARAAGLRPLAASGFTRIKLSSLACVVLASVASIWLLRELVEVNQWLGRELGLGERFVSQERQIRDVLVSAREKGVAVAAVVFVVLSPVCEEVLFRGVAFRGFAAEFGPVRAIAYTGVLFAVFHQKELQLLLLTVLGLYFGLVVWLTGSLWAGIAAHALNNLAVLAASGLWGEDVKSVRAPGWLLALSGVLFATALAALYVQRPRSAPRA